MGHYGCNDLLSILSSVYSAFFTVYLEIALKYKIKQIQ